MVVFYLGHPERAFFCLLLLGFLGAVAGICAYCRRVGIRTAGRPLRPAERADDELSADRRLRQAENQAVLDEASEVQDDAEKGSKAEARRGRIAEALLTKLIVSEGGDNHDDPEVQAKDPDPNTKDAMDDEDCPGGRGSNVNCRVDVEDGQRNILLSDVQRAHGEECNICLGSFQVGDAVAWSDRGGCEHGFHEQCISRWLLAGDECPMCRRSFYLEPEGMEDVDRKIEQAM